MGGLFGKETESKEAGNLNRGLLTSSLSPTLGAVGESYNAIKDLLGGNTAGFQKYKDAAGYNFAAKQGTQGVLGSGAARGLLRSGATGKGLVSFGQGLADQYLGNYLKQLTDMGQLGLGAAGVISDAGKYEKGSASKKNGLGGLVGGLGARIAMSDRRLKENIIQIGVLEDGLPLYSYNYIWDDEDIRQVGVMADEVKEARPWALGPTIAGYDSVNYAKLGRAE